MNDEKANPNDLPRNRRYTAEEVLLLYRIRRSTGWMAFFAMVIAIGSAVAGYFFWQQLSVTKDQLDQMDDLFEQVQKSIIGFHQQAAAVEKAMQEFSETNRKNTDAISQQAAAVVKLTTTAISWQAAVDRPWIGIETVSAAPMVPNQAFAIKVVIRNSGRSPGLNVRPTLYTAVRAVKDTANPHIEECDSCAQTVVPPNGVLYYDLSIGGDILTQEKTDHIKNGTEVVLLWGRVDYSDAVAVEHTTTICMTYVPKPASFSACSHGNDVN